MFNTVLNIVVIILGGIGAFFFVVGGIGIFRMPEPFSRLHCVTQCDTVGAGFIFLALAVHNRFNFHSFKLLLLIIFICVMSATLVHSIARATYKKGILPRTTILPKEFISDVGVVEEEKGVEDV